MYYTYSDYLKNKYHEKVYKLPVNLPVTCPNRLNGACGCDFCAEQGTGFEALNHQLASASILISVSKRRFKRAVKRNRVKRQIREAYRKNKSILLECLQGREQHLAIAFIYLSDELTATAELEEKMKIALARISEKLFS